MYVDDDDGDKRCLDKERETAWLGKLAIGYALGAGHGNWWVKRVGGRGVESEAVAAVDYAIYYVMWPVLSSIANKKGFSGKL